MASAPCSPSLAAAVGRGPRSTAVPGNNKKLTCLCSPTNHPGSFRCSRHRNGPRGPAAPSASEARGRAAKGRSVRALLLQRISCPSDRDRQRQRRRSGDFQPRPSRLRLMNM
ncbi:hypothetical protein SEVIR_1G360300v4 [Setaria viridis]|uniref:Serine-rich protein n=2 Tax=Setaria TaxID=4554 RepID=K3YWW7_SETIT|nr:uncharacterized protein LOC101761145 [Setaria italica]XP_034595154.1 uncharacterized protein LOC117856834 [Setaria viridis]RCV08776.1 hypothetical protein SETIT_1G353600v2 [Setaria italica]TKW42079.1 hypothetical protein SEVIR_1G360300v2 [Setaria viridis]